MKLALLGSIGSWHTWQLLDAASRRGHACRPIDFCTLSVSIGTAGLSIAAADGSLAGLDAILVRMMPPGSLEQVVTRMNILHLLASQGVRVVNSPRAVECAIDKGLTTSLLNRAGLPTPLTVICETVGDARRAFSLLGGDVVLKPLFGSEGRGIVRITDVETLQRICGALVSIRSMLYLQQFIPHDGSDIRVLVLGGLVLGAMRRRNAFDFRTNVAQQAVAERHRATTKEIELALAAAAAVGTCFAGVDLLYDAGGKCQVIEVNAVPGWKAFQQITEVPVADRVVEFLEGL